MLRYLNDKYSVLLCPNCWSFHTVGCHKNSLHHYALVYIVVVEQSFCVSVLERFWCLESHHLYNRSYDTYIFDCVVFSKYFQLIRLDITLRPTHQYVEGPKRVC